MGKSTWLVGWLGWWLLGCEYSYLDLKFSHLVFLGRVELGVQKLGHRCALKLWKGSGREPREDKEGIWIRV